MSDKWFTIKRASRRQLMQRPLLEMLSTENAGKRNNKKSIHTTIKIPLFIEIKRLT